MMFFPFAFQLCWTIIAIISVRGQQIDQNTAVATANIPASTSDKIVVSREALLAKRMDNDDPVADPGWRAPIVLPWPDSHSQSLSVPTVLHHTNLYLETTTASSTLPVEALASIYTSAILSTAIPSSVSITGVSTATSTITVLTTVLVQPTPRSVAIQVSPPLTTNEAATQAIQSTPPRTMPATLQIGLSVGVALCILSLAILASFYIWGYRKTSSAKTASPKPEPRRTNMFHLRDYKNNKDDAEWSIESAEKVAIVARVRAQSVLTVSRSNSRRSNAAVENATATMGIRGREPQTLALNSHPMTPSYTAFDSAAGEKKGPEVKSDTKDDEEEEEGKSDSWPLEK